MKILSTILLVVSLWLAVLLGGQTEAWSWGPALFALALSAGFRLLGKPAENGGGWLWLPLLLASAWIIGRAVHSEVVDFARADSMLLLALMGTAWIVSGMDSAGKGLRMLCLGLALSVVANVAMALVQWRNPDVMWPYAYRPSSMPTGFFSHYNYFSNYLIGASLLLLGRVFFGRDRIWERVIYALAYLITLVIVPLSGSRGGLVALGAGSFVFFVAAVLVCWREKKKWAPAMMMVLPVLAVGGLAIGWLLLTRIQESRGFGTEVTNVVDNASRLEWMSLAMEVADDHPWMGGGSRAYSWEKNLKVRHDGFGRGQFDETFVHNELLQTATDYGLVGVALVLGVLLAFALTTVIGLLSGDAEPETSGSSDALRVGVAGGASALLIQANFSFVFHMLPSAMLLGLMFGVILMLRRRDKPASAVIRWIRHLGGVLIVPFAAYLGWQASSALRLIWPVIYEERPMAVLQPRMAMEHLERASQVWPGYRLLLEKGNWERSLANDPQIDGEERDTRNLSAVDAYRRALGFHPYNPEIAVNLGNACADAGLDEEAEQHLVRAVELQGELEAGFQARYFLARHLYTVWHRRWLKERRAEEALAQFLRVRTLLDEAYELIPWKLRDRSADFRKGVADSIKFLEGAGVRPAGSGD